MTSGRDIAAWNRAAAVYAERTGGADSFFRRAWPFFERRLGALTNQRILDLGCGHGWLSAHLDALGAQTHGIDGSTALNQYPSAPVDPMPWHRQIRGYLQHETWHVDTFGGHWHYHRPLQDYVSVISDVGLLISAMDEPPTLPAHTREPGEWTEYEHWFASIPTMVSIAAIKV